MFTSLYSICGRILETAGISTEEVALVSICVTKALELSLDVRVVPIIRPVIHRILSIQDAMISNAIRGIDEIQNVSIVGRRCVDRLNTHLATMHIFGGQNCRILSCARSPQAFSPVG
jgi:hypothetical protein